jgi:hypothetical protein
MLLLSEKKEHLKCPISKGMFSLLKRVKGISKGMVDRDSD